MQIGTAAAEPGELARGYFDIAQLPTDITEKIPVIIANGENDGPTFWVTASQHAGELNGLAAAMDFVPENRLDELSGQIVVMPNLNPSGLRRTMLTEEGRSSYRTSYYDNDNPNGYWPVLGDGGSDKPGISLEPRVQELICNRLYDELADRVDYHIDLHTMQAGWTSMSILGRVPYGPHRSEDDAWELVEDQERLAEAFGIPITYGGPLPDRWDDWTGTGAITTSLRETQNVTSFTVELGGHSYVEEEHLKAGVTGLKNILRELDMLPEVPVDNEAAPDDPTDFRLKHTPAPHTDTPGISRYHVDVGDVVEEDTPVADIVAPNGEYRTTINAGHRGLVIGRYEGLARYKNDALACLAVEDEHARVAELEE